MLTDEMKRHTLLATEQGKIVEVVEGGDILRSARLTSGGVTKVYFTVQYLLLYVVENLNFLHILRICSHSM